MADFNFCKKCGKVCGVDDDLRCVSCEEFICLICGCTETRACIEPNKNPCGWARPGVCTACDRLN